MPRPTPSPEKLAEAKALAEAIREATAAEIDELAHTLVTTDDRHLFGATEFKIRDLAHRIAAAALQQHLARKKTRMANSTGQERFPWVSDDVFRRTPMLKPKGSASLQSSLPS
jgi:hypothetical protein